MESKVALLFNLLVVITLTEFMNGEENDLQREASELFCIICMEPFRHTDIIAKCDHECAANFHGDCWARCVENKSHCPHCRQNIQQIPQ